MGRLAFQILDQQHQEWFIVGLLPHIWRPLIQQKVTSQPAGARDCNETRSIADRRHERNDTGSYAVGCINNPVGRAYQGKGKTRTGLVYEVRTEGHHKDEFPTLRSIWQLECRIHYPEEDTARSVRNGAIIPLSVHYSRNIIVLQRICFVIFCKSIGHEEKDCHTFDLLRECTLDIYKIQEENTGTYGNNMQV
jgi:hypothetical protein